MKKLLLILILFSVYEISFAKKVRFACDMTGQVVNVTGMHISGDFQTAAGFAGGDWNSATTPLTQEGSTEIYSIIVDIPAFTKYEYKFVNGDLFYEVEFVPEPSRVGYNFNDNRWIYIDSLANDTTNIGALVFGGNAPAGFTMVRFFVDMAAITASPSGVHLAGNFQGFDPSTTIMYNFGAANTNGLYIYEIMAYVPLGTYEYKFYNGNSAGTEETVPGICSVNSNREITVTSDTLLNIVCFGSCIPCATGLNENNFLTGIILAPNPSSEVVIVSWKNNHAVKSVFLNDITGRIVREYKVINDQSIAIEKNNLNAGIYFIRVSDTTDETASAKIIFE